MRSQVSLAAILAVCLTLTPVTAAPAAAALGACNPASQGHYFAGMRFIPGTVRGSSASIEYSGLALCTGGNVGKSASSAWVSIEGLNDISSIYQIGIVRCQVAGCPSTVNWVWAYGREAGPCGVGIMPDAQFLGTASGGHQYRVDYVNQPGIGQTYAIYIDSTMKGWKIAHDLETCWTNGPRRAEMMDEIADQNDQSGGSVSNPQDFTVVRYKNFLGTWVAMSEPLGVGCTLHALSVQKCLVNSTLHNAFRSWDTLVP